MAVDGIDQVETLTKILCGGPSRKGELVQSVYLRLKSHSGKDKAAKVIRLLKAVPNVRRMELELAPHSLSNCNSLLPNHLVKTLCGIRRIVHLRITSLPNSPSWSSGIALSTHQLKRSV